MKLIFPNGEHSQVLLSMGGNRIGSAADNGVVLDKPGVKPLHCIIQQSSAGVNLQVPPTGGAVTVNETPAHEMIALRSGDIITLAGIVMRIAAMDAPRAQAGGPAAPTPLDMGEDNGATRMRMAVPKFILRGVSGPVFGKVFAVAGPTVIGRAPECTIPVTVDEISRRHVQLKPTTDGVNVEDLGSANGTFINGQRVTTGFMKGGDELRLDSVRFMLVAPGDEVASARKSDSSAPSRGNATNNKVIWIALAVVLAVAILLAVMLTR
ncbi:MAG: FHA domain-containing protein [Lysobacteraceae bacterium]